MIHLKVLEKQDQAKPHISGRKKIIKINEMETRIIQRINETKRYFFDNINKINKL
jgi:hypothetical protein